MLGKITVGIVLLVTLYSRGLSCDHSTIQKLWAVSGRYRSEIKGEN